jgi:ATP-dependent Clp protease protease subunit
MGAIAIHHTTHFTDVDTEPAWDGPAEVAKAPNDAFVLGYMHAWQEDGADSMSKQSYKLAHHASGSDDTAASRIGVNLALVRLSSGNIPETDRAGVEDHLRAHRKDAGLEDRMDDQEIADAVAHIAKADDLTAKDRRALLAKVKRQEAMHVSGRAAHEPIRCFEGNAKPHEPFWRFRNDGQEPELELYGFISEYSWFDDDVTPKMFKTDLYNQGKGGPISVRINSWGGDVVAASAMRAILAEYPGKITVHVDGMAASAAVIVAIAGDRILIQDSAYMMIHNPSIDVFFAHLDIGVLAALLNELQIVRDGIVDAYASRTGLTDGKLQSMMDATTWMTAKEAVTLGFADEVVGAGKPATQAQALGASFSNVLKNYINVPAALLALEQPNTNQVQPVEAEDLVRQFESLRSEIRKTL